MRGVRVVWPWQTGVGNGDQEESCMSRALAIRWARRYPRGGLGGLVLGLLAVLVVVDVLPRAEAYYACSSDADCQYPTCNDRSCSQYSFRCNNGVKDDYCVSIS